MKEVYINMNPNEIESEYLNGVYNEIANTLGIEAAIVAEYDGKNIRQLATKYGYSEKWIRKMIKEHKK